MASALPAANNLGYSVTTRNYSWADLVARSWGSEFKAPDHGIYQFSNGRKFDSTDGRLVTKTTNRIGIEGGGSIQLEDGSYLLQE